MSAIADQPAGETNQQVSPHDEIHTTVKRSDLDSTARIARSLFLIALIVAFGFILGLAFYGASHSDRIYEGVTISGIEVGGLTKAEARDAVRADLSQVANQPVILSADDQEYSFDPESAGISVDIDETVDTAFAYARSGSFWDRSGEWVSTLIHGHEVSAQLSVDYATLDSMLSAIAPMVIRQPKDAYIEVDGNTPKIVPELPGYAYDVGATRDLILTQLGSLGSGPVELVRPVQNAKVTVDGLQPALKQIETAVSAPLVVSGLDQYWGISQADIERIVSVSEDNEIAVDRDAVAGFVDSVANEVDRDPKNAGLSVNSNGILAPIPSVQGITVNRKSVTNDIVSALSSGVSGVKLTYSTQDPAISDAQAIAAADAGEAMLNAGVTITWPDGSAQLTRGDLLTALTFKIKPDQDSPFVFDFDNALLKKTLEPEFASIATKVVEPQLRFVNGKITIAVEGKNGRSVNEDKSLANITDAALNGTGKASLVIDTLKPELSSAAIADISLDDVLAESSTYYGDSSDARRENVERAVELENGWLIAPGQQFSYAEFIGPVDEDHGFVTGFGIVDDPSGTGVTTAPVVGGGICQVSTTLFQAGFWAGLQIDERYSHPYWIQAYGEPPHGMQGLDAMVNIEDSGSLDLRMTNTTGNWIAIEVTADGTTVTARVLGVDPGWTIDVGQPIISAITKPPTETRFTDSPELPQGEQLQVEYAQKGFTAEITRVIKDKDGTLLDSSYIISTYSPSENTILRGAGEAPSATDATPES